jgi:hypothetical protein
MARLSRFRSLEHPHGSVSVARLIYQIESSDDFEFVVAHQLCSLTRVRNVYQHVYMWKFDQAFAALKLRNTYLLASV